MMVNNSGISQRTTRGWKLLITWKDGSTSWVHVKDLKESFPVQVAEYAIVNKIVEERAFAWWLASMSYGKNVTELLRRWLKSRYYSYWERTHKYGILLPKSVKATLRINKETGTDFCWQKAIKLEMKAIECAFEFLRDDDKMPVGYQHIDCHMIFDVEILLDRKARYVAGGHETEPSKDVKFASVMSRDSIHIAFTVVALNDLQVPSADVSRAYLNAKAAEKVYTTAGTEFGPD
jgi:hypothetical protein